MTKKQIIILVALGVFVLLLVLGGALRREKEEALLQVAEKAEVGKEEAKERPTKGVPLPDYTKEVPKQAVETKPKTEVKVETRAGEPKSKLGVYEITATSAGYTPSSITVKQNSIVFLELTSKGGAYDLFSPMMGFYLSAGDGKTDKLSFEAPVAGTFAFRCRDHCPREGIIQGTLVVLP